MQLQRLLSYTRKAVDEYGMIQEGDHIAVGILRISIPDALVCASRSETFLSKKV